MAYLYIFATVIFTVYGQIVLKYRIAIHGMMPASWPEKAAFFMRLLLDPWVISGFIAAFIASIFWMAALSKFELSFAYPFMSLSFVLVFLFSVFVLNESLSIAKVTGLLFVIAGLMIMSIF